MKYRLKKWYPKLPQEWKSYKADIIATKRGCYTYIADMTKLNECEVEENPEFWEKLVEKEYEILKYKSDWSGKIYNGGCVDDSGFKIYSIKRLSDGEVFTVGDKYKNMSGTFTIKGFKITDDFVCVEAKEYGGCGLNNIQPLKEPLFTTEDEEYVEKEYEILLLKSNGFIYNQHTKYFDRELNNPEAEIYSVMRLKDMEVFTVGDEIENGIYIGEITQFEVEDNECKVVVEDAWYCNVGDTNFQHAKKPLFTTEDGVDIYEGEKTFMVDKDRYEIVWRYDQTPKKIKISGNALFFSTKEKAQEYIDLNKPRYSKQELMDAINNVKSYEESPINLLKLIKELNL